MRRQKKTPLAVFIILSLLIINLLFIYNCVSYVSDAVITKAQVSRSKQRLKLAFVWRDIEDFENHVSTAVTSFISSRTDACAVIVSDNPPYPPLNLPKSPRVKSVVLNRKLSASFRQENMEDLLNSEFVILVPDGVELVSPDLIDHIHLKLSSLSDNVRMIAWPAGVNASLQCVGLNVKLKEWTLQYYSMLTDSCYAVKGMFAIGIRTSDLLMLPHPLEKPMHHALFIQTALLKWQVVIARENIFKTTKVLFSDPHNQWKHKTNEYSLLKSMYKKFGIKLVQSVEGHKQWFGCSKDTSRCFGTIINDMPEYLFEGRWTPPCCLQALRETARHVFSVLQASGVRYWLEGGSLLGAARHNDIIPWDYDVDVGIYEQDIVKCRELKETQNSDYVDQSGFMWQKATEGQFIRVQYSESNHLHVDIFPFYSRNGTMTKNTWLKTHRQDMEFPEKYLLPLEKLNFAGIQASVPNKYHSFLELKFGQGVIENPKYPDMSEVF